jgi:hypothetical protein
MNSCEMPPRKRVRGGMADGILNTVQSTTISRTRHKHKARIPKPMNNNGPKQPVCGAERLATPDSQGFHHRSLLGPSLQQGWAAEAADGRLIWVEGSVEELAHSTDTTVRQDQQDEVEQECLFKIPKGFTEEYQALLVATRADLARGTIREIKCRLCPNTKFNEWGQFKRHCDCTESHPLKISFCEYCGDYFARSDSCQRHRENRPAQCRRVSPERAATKRKETLKAHREFLKIIIDSAGEEVIGMPFSKTMKGICPDSSKKRRKE